MDQGTVAPPGHSAAIATAPDTDQPARQLRLGGLWRQPDFLKFWAGETISLCGRPAGLPAVLLLAGCVALSGCSVTRSNIQVIIPRHLFSRVNAGYRVFITGTVPVGPLLAGALGELIGLRATLALCALSTLAALPWAIFSPLPRLRAMPDPESASVAPEPAVPATALAW